MKMVFNIYGTWRWVTFEKFMMKRGTELLLWLIIAKINFSIISVMVKSLKYDVSTIIISNFD